MEIGLRFAILGVIGCILFRRKTRPTRDSGNRPFSIMEIRLDRYLFLRASISGSSKCLTIEEVNKSIDIAFFGKSAIARFHLNSGGRANLISSRLVSEPWYMSFNHSSTAFFAASPVRELSPSHNEPCHGCAFDPISLYLRDFFDVSQNCLLFSVRKNLKFSRHNSAHLHCRRES